MIKDSAIVSKSTDVVSVNPTINELSQTLQNITQNLSAQQSTRITESDSISLAEDEAAKVKMQITSIWDSKMERRKDAY